MMMMMYVRNKRSMISNRRKPKRTTTTTTTTTTNKHQINHFFAFLVVKLVVVCACKGCPWLGIYIYLTWLERVWAGYDLARPRAFVAANKRCERCSSRKLLRPPRRSGAAGSVRSRRHGGISFLGGGGVIGLHYLFFCVRRPFFFLYNRGGKRDDTYL